LIFIRLHGYEIDADLIILDNHPGTWYETLKHQGISVGYLFGANYNDITEEARKKNIPAILRICGILNSRKKKSSSGCLD
jgi:hypothetical protein